VFLGESTFLKGESLSSLARMDHRPQWGSERSVAIAGNKLVLVNPYPGAPIPLLVSTNNTDSYLVDLPPGSSGLLRVKYVQDQFVSVGEKGLIIRSADGEHWTRSITTTTNDLYDIASGNGLWVAVGTNGTVLVSNDANAFPRTSSGTTGQLYGVTYGANGFVAVGESGTILRSSDGQHWSLQQVQPVDLFGVTYGNGRYVAVGASGHMFDSSDGLAWNHSRPGGARLNGVAYADGLFLAMEAGTSVGYVSPDARSWSAVALPKGSSSVSASENSIWITGTNNTSIFVAKVRRDAPQIVLNSKINEYGVLELSFTVPFGGSFELISSTDPGSTNWEHASSLSLDHPQETTFYYVLDGPARFFRVRLVQ
jgi:hypothetical protein